MAVTDLTGYTWTPNESGVEWLGSDVSYSVNYNLISTTDVVLTGQTEFSSKFVSAGGGRTKEWAIGVSNGYYSGVLTTNTFLSCAGSYSSLLTPTSNGAYILKEINFTGGTDITNTTFISWLEANGTLTAPILSNDYAITHTLTNLTHGNITLQITPDSGYTYPSSVTVTDGTLVSYDSLTGAAVISGDDTTSVSCECVEEVSGYEVELSGGSGIGNEYVYVQINDDLTWYYAQMGQASGFDINGTNIPNAYSISAEYSIGIPNVSKIKIGTQGNPTDYTGPFYGSGASTGDFVNLTFTSTGSSAPAYATGEITMTQDSKISFRGDD